LWRPPESFDSNRYSKQGDVYQIGIVAYQLLGGSLDYDGMSYLDKNEQKQFDATEDEVDRSIFVDSVIKHRAESGTLINIGSLPGWVDSKIRRNIKIMCHPNPSRRSASLADVAAMLTSIRGRIKNWRWNDDIAVLEQENSVVEVRPTAKPGEYIAYRNSGNGFRRIPNLPAATLASVTLKI
jgi:hypothetical protein